jgi:hypothetical protein
MRAGRSAESSNACCACTGRRSTRSRRESGEPRRRSAIPRASPQPSPSFARWPKPPSGPSRRTVGHHLAARRGREGAEQAFAGAWSPLGRSLRCLPGRGGDRRRGRLEAARWFARIPERIAIASGPRPPRRAARFAGGRDAEELRSAYRDLLDYRQDALGWSAEAGSTSCSRARPVVRRPAARPDPRRAGRRARADQAQPALEQARKALGRARPRPPRRSRGGQSSSGESEVEQMRPGGRGARGTWPRVAPWCRCGDPRSAGRRSPRRIACGSTLGLPLLPLRSERDLLHPQD